MKRCLLYSFKTMLLILVFTSLVYPATSGTDSTATAEITSIKSSDNNHPDEAGLENEIIIEVKNAPQLNDEGLSSQKIILFFDGMPLNTVFPRENRVDKQGNGKLRFFIPHDDNAGKLWGNLLRASNGDNFFKRFKKLVCINVGLYNPSTAQLSHVTNEYFFTIVLVRPLWFWIAVIFLTLLLIFFIVLAVKSDIIRDMGGNPPNGTRRPFSLARTQMAIWTFLIIAAWLLLYVFQHTLNSISDSMTVLMGISSATGLGAVAFKQDKSLPIMSTRGFFTDLVSDSQGVSFHRFQIFAWTLVMVVVFCRQVIFYFEMPQFDASLLVLMGISSGTYIGYKYTGNPVKQSPEPDKANGTIAPATAPADTVNDADTTQPGA